MKAALKQDILKMLETLHQAHKEIRNNVKIKDIVSAQQLLGECQECAIVMGTTIEESEGEGFVTVPYIEEYCEILYRIHQSLEVKSDYNLNQISSLLKRQLTVIENSVKNDIAVKKEFVFLPYKVSMWDSLESVWRAAEEDPECEAVVIPIPYYDKNPDGTLRNEYYEGNEFPEDVPITYYEDYNFEDRHPDVIFIHNPYDQNNYVTSVHPYFYSGNLKKLCDRLIYIPYYVSAETSPDNQDAMKDREGFVLSNGVLNADYVIVQSENTKKLYVNILEKNFPKVARSYWEQKILGLGSPKLDRVNRIQRDDSKLPENWRNVIYTEENERKKVIFYNISVSTLLNTPEMLEKIKDTLEYFKNNTDVALWWRPHPLYEATLASMRPGMLEEYREIVTGYKEEGWGVFDEGVDLEWAIAETDAYYGDSSSVVQLYKEAQKPVMIQHPAVRAEQEVHAEDIPIWPSCFFVDDNDVWFVHGKMSVLMRYAIAEGHVYVVDRIPNESFFKENLFQGICKWKNCIFLIPCWAGEIVIYDIKDKKFQNLPLRNAEKFRQKLLFCKTYSFGDYLYCIPYCYDSILKIDKDSLMIEYIDISEILGAQGFHMPEAYISDAARIENEVAGVIYGTNKVLLFDLETNKIQICSGKEGRQYTHLTGLNRSLYIYDKYEKDVIRWNREQNNSEEIFAQATFDNAVLKKAGLHYIILDNNCDSRFTVMDEKGNIVFQNNEYRTAGRKDLDYSYYDGIENDQILLKRSYFFSTSENRLYQFEEDMVKGKLDFFITEGEWRKLKTLPGNQKEMEVTEYRLYNIKRWLYVIQEMSVGEKEMWCNYGRLILDTVKEST